MSIHSDLKRPSLEHRVSELSHGDQVCSICADSDEQIRVIAPFVRDGLTRGDKCTLALYGITPDEVVLALDALGVETNKFIESHALTFLSQDPDSRFLAEARVKIFAKEQHEAICAGFSGLRIVDQMAWVLGSDAPRDVLITFGIALSRFLSTSQSIVLSQYRQPDFDLSLIHDAIRTSPILYLNAEPCSNLFYEPAEILLNPEPEKSPAFKRTRVDWWIKLLRKVQADDRQRDLLQDQIRQVQKLDAIGQLAGGIAHDFNNLLSIIIGYSDLLIKESQEGSRTHDFLSEIRGAAHRSTDLTKQLLAFSRKQMIAPTVLNLNAVISEFHRLLARIIGEDIEISLSLAHDLGMVKVDRTQFEQVIMNLAVNARDAMPQGGKVTIVTKNIELSADYAAEHLNAQPGAYVMLSVSDTGPGIAEDLRQHIFEPFFSTKEQGKGTGLGLAVVHGIVMQSGGRIEFYSEVGIGTSFKIYLPRMDAMRAAPSTSSTGESPQMGKENILLVEDDRALRAYTRNVIEGLGYKVAEGTDGLHAIDVAAEHTEPFDLLVTDVVMPGLSGPELSSRLVALYPALKVLYLSGYTNDTVVRHGILEQEVNFLQKPFTPKELASAIRRALDLHN